SAARALREVGVDFKIVDKGRAILISDGTDSDALHLQLAEQEALPHQNDLFDVSKVPGVSASETGMKDLKRQAVQERLAQTIRQYPQVQKATVFITGSRPRAFVGETAPAKASVMLMLRGQLSKRQLNGIANLVAGAEEGLAAEAVTISDQYGELRGGADSGSAERGDRLEFKKAYEKYLASKAMNSLRVLGPSCAQVTVNLDLDFNEMVRKTREINEEIRVRREEKHFERSSDSSPINGGIVGMDRSIAIRIPLLRRALDGQTSREERTETKWAYPERMVIEKVLPGSVERMTVSILVNERYMTQAESITEIVKSAVGFDMTRDDFAARVLPFHEPEMAANAAVPWWQLLVHPKVLLPGFGCFAMFALILHLLSRQRILKLHQQQLEAASRPALELNRILTASNDRIESHPEIIAQALEIWIEEDVRQTDEEPVLAEAVVEAKVPSEMSDS
ncbi:MAG: flagellar M-ring protein FliF C-terminal domain-containing protein, partial [Planctomycetota bacterium]|nr:flagellar M-ring protein FliF C-terminal domain-containing protein [Planctomycetota bacterium]